MMVFKKIDLQRLSGIRSVLGIDLTEDRARIVELQRTGSILNRFDVKVKVLQSFLVEFPHGASSETKAEIIKTALTDRGIKSIYAVSSLRSLGVKTIETDIPSSVRNIDEWIQEQQEKLLRLPVSSQRIVHAYEILSHEEQGFHVEISFARTDDLDVFADVRSGERGRWRMKLLSKMVMIKKPIEFVKINSYFINIIHLLTVC